MVVGYYKEIYCALDIDIDQLIAFLKDIIRDTDVKCECKEDKYTLIMDNLDIWVEGWLNDKYSDLDNKSVVLIICQIREYLEINLINYL